ncbi:MAG: hypothetical protein Q7S19_01740 [bacterium]|nr:hypothetical protein [bacterium]
MDEIILFFSKIWLCGVFISICIIILCTVRDLLYDLEWFVHGDGSGKIPNQIINEITKEETKWETTLRPTGIDIENYAKEGRLVIFNFKSDDRAERRYFINDLKKELSYIKEKVALMILAALWWPFFLGCFFHDMYYGEIKPLLWIMPLITKIRPEKKFAIVKSCTAKHHFYHIVFRNKFCVCDRVGQNVYIKEKIMELGGTNYHKIDQRLEAYVNERDLEHLEDRVH